MVPGTLQIVAECKGRPPLFGRHPILHRFSAQFLQRHIQTANVREPIIPAPAPVRLRPADSPDHRVILALGPPGFVPGAFQSQLLLANGIRPSLPRFLLWQESQPQRQSASRHGPRQGRWLDQLPGGKGDTLVRCPLYHVTRAMVARENCFRRSCGTVRSVCGRSGRTAAIHRATLLLRAPARRIPSHGYACCCLQSIAGSFSNSSHERYDSWCSLISTCQSSCANSVALRDVLCTFTILMAIRWLLIA